MSGKIRFSGPLTDPASRGIKFPGGGDVSGSLQVIQDPSNNQLPIQLSNSVFGIGRVGQSGSIVFVNDITGALNGQIGMPPGTANLSIIGNNISLIDNASGVVISNGSAVTSNGALTVKGTGGNIISLRSSANSQVFSVTNNGVTSTSLEYSINNLVRMQSAANGVLAIFNATGLDFSRLIFGTNDLGGISISKSGTEMRAMLGNASAYCAFRSSSYQSDDLSAGALFASRPVKFGDRGTITEAAFVSMNLTRQLAIEHNGVVYYIPVSQTLIP